MSAYSLGEIPVATAGTPVRITANESDPAARLPCKSILVQRHDTTETGVIYLIKGSTAFSATQTTTGDGFIFAVGSAATLNSGSMRINDQPNGLNAADFYLDASANAQSAMVSVVRG